MQIVIWNDILTKKEKVVNIVYGETSTYVENWIRRYFEVEIESLKSDGCVEYSVEECDGLFYLVKKFQCIQKGYLYNTTENISERLQSIRVVTFSDESKVSVNTSSLWNGLNSEISHRVMRHVDQKTLFEMDLKFDQIVKTKQNWTSTELVMLRSELTNNYEKELYSSIVKKWFGKTSTPRSLTNHTLNCKTILVDEQGRLKGQGNLPDISKFSGKACALEFHVISKD